MKFSEGRNHKVVSTSTADTVGKVHEYVVDPLTHAVLALQLKKTSDGDTLRWSDITAFGTDAVTVSGADTIGAPGADVTALTGKDHVLIGKRVLSNAGDELGHVKDVEFDAETGVLEELLLADATVAGARLVGVGSYAVVVKQE